MKKTILFLSVVLFLLIIFSLSFWLYEAQFIVGRASTINVGFSKENSYLFTSPLQAKGNGLEKIRVTVFILSTQGLGIAGTNVSLESDSKLKIEAVQGLTDGFGKAVFDISSTQAGEYYLEVFAEGKQLQQKAHLSFN